MDNQLTTVDYLVIGAGPAGLQLGYFLEQQGLDYLIVDGGAQSGAFFQRYPRHRKLISINKVHTGYFEPEKNLRWDWNSLLGDPDECLFKHFSTRYFPDADDMVRYLHEYTEHYKLRVKYNAPIVHVTRDSAFEATDASGARYRCKRLIVASGVSKSYLPPIEGIELAERYEEFSIDPQQFAGQSVLVIGKGNSGFETAENLIETAALIHIISPHPIKMAWQTKFVGHLRAVNNNFLDTYQLKAQNAVLDGEIRKIERRGDQYAVSVAYSHAAGECEELLYDRVLACTGFRFDATPFDETCRPELAINNRFPRQTAEWESINVRDMFFAGTITQQRDYRKTTSGFVHGFRYNVRALSRMLMERYENISWPRRAVELRVQPMADAILKRVNLSSGLWQQFGFLCDVIVPDGTSQGWYYEEMPVDYLQLNGIATQPHYFTVTLEFGVLDGDPFAIERRPDPAMARESKFLHPVIRHYQFGVLASEHHLLEDLHADWSKDCHRDPLTAYLAQELQLATSRKQEADLAAVVG